jgi:hypothetical protein
MVGPQGLWVKTRLVNYNPGTRDLVRTSEIGVVAAFGALTVAAAAAAIRANGLKIGLGLKPAHQLQSVAFTAGPTGMAVPLASPTVLNPVPAVSAMLQNVFGNDLQWRGYQIAGAQIPALGWPAADDRLYFVISLRNFQVQHALDMHTVPVVAVLDSFPDFTQHYALGLAVFTIGKAHGSIEFDSQVLGTT